MAIETTLAVPDLPLAMAEEALGAYGAVVDTPPDADGTRSIVQVTARKAGSPTAHA